MAMLLPSSCTQQLKEIANGNDSKAYATTFRVILA
jgi:hypothetical protein